jgi:hypothetical protein
MTQEQTGYCILGITRNGNRFRPSDWVERIATAFASFGSSQRLHYNNLIRPSVYDGLRCLFVATSLAVIDPAGFDFVMDFANSNQLQVKQIGLAQAGKSTAIKLPDVA